MKTFLFTCLASLTLLFSSCMKHAEDYVPGYGTALNTWTFTDGSNYYFGNFSTDPVLNTTLQNNNTYTLDMTGTEIRSGEVLTMAISLADTDFAVKSYQSGVSGSNHFTGFYYSGSASSSAAIYSSTNNSPGAVMTYNISQYDPVKSVATIAFHGQAFDASGNKISITKGKLKAHIERR